MDKTDVNQLLLGGVNESLEDIPLDDSPNNLQHSSDRLIARKCVLEVMRCLNYATEFNTQLTNEFNTYDLSYKINHKNSFQRSIKDICCDTQITNTFLKEYLDPYIRKENSSTKKKGFSSFFYGSAPALTQDEYLQLLEKLLAFDDVSKHFTFEDIQKAYDNECLMAALSMSRSR